MAKLISHVHVTNPEGSVVALAPGDPVPDWAVSQIKNPKAWEGGQVPDPIEPVAAPVADHAKVPPRRGAGSGADVWAAYAASREVAVPDGASREDIIAALDAAGVPTVAEPASQ